MGKSFNNDVFNNNFDFESINGLNISPEAINENKKASGKPIININDIDLKETMEELKKSKKESSTPKEDLTILVNENLKRNNELTRQEDFISPITETQKKNNAIYTKKTMIFKQEYLDIINGLASINDIQIKDVLNQLLERAINELDDKVREKAQKEGKKVNIKTEKSIF